MRFSNQHNQPRSKVQVYVEADSELLVPALERILNENHIRLDLIDSPVKEQSLPLFIVCKSNLTAASTIEKFSLTNPLIYWLPGTTFDGSNEQPAIGHWLSNWQQPKQLQAILSLFNHSATISTKLAHADKKLSLLSGFLGSTPLR
ncbi:hypothetical protein RS130_03320 [Paraglaciecola aquimarina]|uniref:Uncharacterized protein n=1 Tax=Paraglaciecola aquimarina TaxID=1235557 RepID=A0ABU3SSY3_9ALTE|nr:hypothetical protein [Paraglaciecola aquimarina]MDU0353088.1 hypothetical protein [Paraglaciecola aquimarina]